MQTGIAGGTVAIPIPSAIFICLAIGLGMTMPAAAGLAATPEEAEAFSEKAAYVIRTNDVVCGVGYCK